jgi:hypothetical protein
MAETLGKMEKPEAESFKQERKLIYVPLLILPPTDDDPELDKLINRYWQEATSQVENLAGKLGGVKKIFHELTPSGETGLKGIETLRSGSLGIVKGLVEGGARLEAIEDEPTLLEYLDWNRCLSAGLESTKVFGQVYDFYVKARAQRNIALSQNIDKNLGKEELGLVFLREGHQVQFPAGIEVFYVSPPGLDAIRRHLSERHEQSEASQEKQDGNETPTENKEEQSPD